jgi:hypothetical protein
MANRHENRWQTRWPKIRQTSEPTTNTAPTDATEAFIHHKKSLPSQILLLHSLFALLPNRPSILKVTLNLSNQAYVPTIG